jgi:hypothetical protein
MKSEPYELKRILNIPINNEHEEAVYFTIGNGSGKDTKIEFYTERWRSADEWRVLLKEILKEIDSFEKEGIIE